MKRLIAIGKYFRRKKSTIIDLSAYRELRRKRQEANNEVSKSRKKKE